MRGGGTPGPDIGDNGPADSAQLNGPGGIAIDAAGDLYIADIHYQRIRKVTVATGIITTLAGTGTLGFSGDNNLAINAELSVPTGITVAPGGNLYIVDFGNNRIRRIGWPEQVNQAPINKQTITIYPNPVTTQLTVESTNQIHQIVIANLLGQFIYAQDCNTQKVQMNIRDLSTGIYMIKINGTETRKFVKE